MRKKYNNQLEFDFRPSTLKITNEYFERYERISKILEENPEVVELVHRNLERVSKGTGQNGSSRRCEYSSDQ